MVKTVDFDSMIVGSNPAWAARKKERNDLQMAFVELLTKLRELCDYDEAEEYRDLIEDVCSKCKYYGFSECDFCPAMNTYKTIKRHCS